MDAYRLDVLVRDSIKDVVRSIIESEYGITNWGDKYIKPYIQEIMNKHLHMHLGSPERIEERIQEAVDGVTAQLVADLTRRVLSNKKNKKQ